MDLMFREVHRSNMTKLCPDIDSANKSVEFYKTSAEYKDVYKTPAIKQKGKYFVVYNIDNSKILKNINWEEPNLQQFF
jgi:hypothetical protein